MSAGAPPSAGPPATPAAAASSAAARGRLGALGWGSLLLALVAALALLGPLLWPQDPLRQDYRALYAAPSLQHPLGTDALGRDVFARALAGGRVSMAIGFSAALLTAFLGLALGAVAAGVGGLVDLLLTRLFDALLAFPNFLLILLTVTVLGGGIAPTLLALAVAGSPLYYRLVRGYARRELAADYVHAAAALGAKRWRLVLRHALPNFAGPLLVQLAGTMAGFLLAEASLSYLGLGVALPTPSWGNVLSDARAALLRQPWAAVGPGLFLAACTLGLQLLANGLRDRLDHRGGRGA